ncbi:AraC family transcriptional regulator [Stenotrophomonas sp. 24(2023)]|uniref:AraC family transcriptional regulator n=1 Tax=Stenotrophomonas sp. 24(2023) TaxID=3068324 RepID=UPI0027DF304D|nr:AraC family transcriptional regulator [Stenotrophomonas sp. 24(2023)]WMJ68800.1 AraC family transcriptional regulator ligand-binding domain-containing protein [Stenotrophomonas sp. 24(2023)]
MKGRDMFAIPPGVIASAGFSVERLCALAGVKPSHAFATDDFFRLWKAVEGEINDRSAGLRFGSEGIGRGYGTPSIVALHAPDFRQAIAALARYKHLTCPELVEVELKGEEAIVRYRWLQATGQVPRLLVDTTMAALKAMAHKGSAGRIAPLRLELTRRPMDHALLRHHFGCPIAFSATSDAMVFDRAALDVPFVTANGGAFALVVEGIENRLAGGAGFPALVAQVRVAIARQLSEGRPSSIAAVSRRIGASSRTLQRRLSELGTTYQQQLDGVRRTTASRLLAMTDLDAIAIAMLLGFAEPNSFTRAFREWERTTPNRWRERQARHQA